ncbi:GNAT family N-acetyltransferase [Streptomyces sp. 549]|uniref:GNAT family N-acetyltransferase n=1 Tax=Streptomyces sp. 549 TaxID=3049076 RepID=UPI0024C2EDCA|nr:GNAT family N-acetyltransferase [Streptomyces sp. 549]MDK1476242.1 GNAT family N-acetyltransferase [Streptomyces sp. 549]
MRYEVRTVGEHEWRQLRELRLAALADPVAPLAFFTPYVTAVGYSDAEWQQRAREGQGSDVGATFVGVDTSAAGAWAGMVGVRLEEQQALLAGVYVRPEHRGGPLAGLMFDAAAEWCWQHTSLKRLVLHVHEDNVRAERFYLSRGFRRTAEREPDPLDTNRYAYLMELLRPL